jgi:hypothetical protein
MKWALIENMVTIAATAALVLGLYWLGAGAHAGWGFLLLVNINTPSRVKAVSEDGP